MTRNTVKDYIIRAYILCDKRNNEIRDSCSRPYYKVYGYINIIIYRCTESLFRVGRYIISMYTGKNHSTSRNNDSKFTCTIGLCSKHFRECWISLIWVRCSSRCILYHFCRVKEPCTVLIIYWKTNAIRLEK